jgi:peptidylprolyl isomerase
MAGIWVRLANIAEYKDEILTMIEPGKTVKVHYKGTLDDGSVFDSSEGRDPLEFQVGSGQVIPGFDSAIQQMDVGSSKTITIPSNEAYGEVRQEMIALIPHAQLPDDLDPQVGQMLQLQTPQGALPVRVTDVKDNGIVIDGNHPLAGEDLTFELTVVEAA